VRASPGDLSLLVFGALPNPGGWAGASAFRPGRRTGTFGRRRSPTQLLRTLAKRSTGGAAAIAQLNASTTLSVWGSGPVGGYGGVAAGAISLLAVLLHYCLRGVEIFSFLKNASELTGYICSVTERCCGCCRSSSCCGRRQTRSRWIVLLDREELWELEEIHRHERAVASAWTIWNRIGRAIKTSHLGLAFVPFTWQLWNGYSTRLRAHAWHQRRRARQQLNQH
jgi:hypothetical protein